VTLRDSNEVPYPFFTPDNLINNVILDDLDVEDLIVQKRKECEEIGGKFDEYFLECMMEEEEIVE
jgi:hypothetical protein